MTKAERRLAVATLGCKVNQYDTDAVVTQFLQAGYTLVDFREEADVYLINTCTVTNLGDRKSRQMIRRAHRLNPQAQVVVMGCLAQTSPEEVAGLEGVSLVVGTDGRHRIVEELERLRAGDQKTLVEDIFQVTEFEDLPALGFSGRTRAALKIQDGCNQFCTYCRVPFARGRSRSRSPKSVLQQAGLLVEQGYKEIVLTGVHLGLYGADLDPPLSLAEISRQVASYPGLLRLRISSVDPHEVTGELIELLSSHPVVCRHVHIPLQSGSDRILQLMRRNYTAAEFLDIVRTLRQRIPGIAITTDIMVGFPGETEEDFERTLELTREAAFSRIHVFQYSKRQGTRAASFPGQIPAEIKESRSQRLIELGYTLAEQFHRSLVGQVVEVLVEEDAGLALGHTDNYVQVRFPAGQGDLVGELVRVKVLGSDREGVWGERAEGR
ncbi:MAG TPA: tRNA (N(6)-L-threonylcarbamoyladenosine(37)-C(2))-methylthiotransferase MtaB [Limnochordia bacterium]|nr:tRNA (N(6)-L-threonylcarbamoyladenosine(37)-C(2))-methylthiotransferase MtaB [Limnochordia bacterium]